MSKLSQCSAHGVLATLRCPTCHKPLCSKCKTTDGCCSEKCFKSRQKFGGPLKPVDRRSNIWGNLFFLALLAGGGYAAARYFGVL